MMNKVPPHLCVKCKGYRKLCGLPVCPIMERFRANIKAIMSVKGREVEGATPPSVIVGEAHYPNVPVIFNVPPNVRGDAAKGFDDPLGWWGRVSLDEIIRRRAQQVASIVKVKVTDPFKLYDNEVSVAAVSLKPVESEAVLRKPPKPKLTFSAGLDPVGPAAEAEEVRVVGNAHLPRPLERLIWDDLPASEGAVELYRRDVDMYTIIRAFSLGLLGRVRRRKLVPTRWAITAVDRTLTNYMLRRVRTLPEISDVELYEGEYLGNKFKVILYPGRPLIEWVEVWYPLTVFTQTALKPLIIYNKATPLGRTETLDGGFDAAKFAVIEHLSRRGRKAAAIVIREITPQYYASVGNWHIRETVRNALSQPPRKYRTLLDAVKDAVAGMDPSTRREVVELLVPVKYRKLDDFLR